MKLLCEALVLKLILSDDTIHNAEARANELYIDTVIEILGQLEAWADRTLEGNERTNALELLNRIKNDRDACYKLAIVLTEGGSGAFSAALIERMTVGGIPFGRDAITLILNDTLIYGAMSELCETLDGVLDMEASVQVVNADGTWGTQGFWLNETTIDGVTYPAGWFTDASGATPADIALEPGQAVFFKTTALNAKVVIPSAL
jgi:hypothetical protein